MKEEICGKNECFKINDQKSLKLKNLERWMPRIDTTKC